MEVEVTDSTGFIAARIYQFEGGFMKTCQVFGWYTLHNEIQIGNFKADYLYSFDCNEPIHVHVQRERMICKFWLDPTTLSQNNGYSPSELNRIRSLIDTHRDKIVEAWHEHCG
jgi:hypothetical protein